MKLQPNSNDRAKKFIHEVLKTETLYFLKDSEGLACTVESDEENPYNIIPFWSKKFIPQAKEWGAAHDEDLVIDEISLELFVKNWLKSMHQEGVLIGINWDKDGFGHEIKPYTLLELLAKAAEGEDISFN